MMGNMYCPVSELWSQIYRNAKLLCYEMGQLSGQNHLAVSVSFFRFYIVNNLSEPRVRKMCDVVDWPNVGHVPPWAVLASERHAKIVMASSTSGWMKFNAVYRWIFGWVLTLLG